MPRAPRSASSMYCRATRKDRTVGYSAGALRTAVTTARPHLAPTLERDHHRAWVRIDHEPVHPSHEHIPTQTEESRELAFLTRSPP